MDWFKNLKTSQKIIGLVILMVTFIAVVGFVGFINLQKSAKSIDSLYNDNLLAIKWMNENRTHVRANEANLLWIISSTNNAIKQKHIDDISARAKKFNANMENLKKLNLSDDEKNTLNETQNYLEEYRNVRKVVISLSLQGKSKEAYDYFLTNKEPFEQLTKCLITLGNIIEKEAHNRSVENNKNSISAQTSIITIIIISIIMAIAVGILISRLIANPLLAMLQKVKEVSNGNLAIEKIEIDSRDEVGQLGVAFNIMTENLRNLVKTVAQSVDEMSSGSEEMTAAAEQTAQGAQQVSSSVTQLAAGSQQIAMGVTQLATGSQEQSKLVNNTLSNINSMNQAIQVISEGSENTIQISKSSEANASNGQNQAAKAVEKVNQLKVSATEISGTINELGKLSSDIEMIVDLIKTIAGQTNLLALNAAIEAARAGEHGKGFAVVAEEVKKLAGQSADATDKITSMIKEIQNKTNMAVISMNENVQEVADGVIIIKDVGQSLEQILNAAKETTQHIQEISKEVGNLAKNSDNVVKMVENIASITEEASASAEEISSITEESAASAEEIASITQEQTASLEEINASSNSLAKLAENLQKQVSVFKI